MKNLERNIPWFGIGKLQIFYKCKNCNSKQILEEKTVLYLFKKIFSIPFLAKVK